MVHEVTRYDSLADAFRDWDTTMANRRFVQRLLSRIDVEGYERYADHFRVIRTSGESALRVYYGATIGFRSPEEITDAVPGASVTPSTWMPGTWRAPHPDQAPERDASGMARRARWSPGTPCPECGEVLSVSGVCNNPDCSEFGIAR